MNKQYRINWIEWVTNPSRLKLPYLCLAASLSLFALPAFAATSYAGRVDEIEVWANGNVDFTITPAVTDCGQGRFVINKSMPGAQSLIAAVYMAKAQDRPIRITSYGCIVADNYGTTPNWISTDYLYIQQ